MPEILKEIDKFINLSILVATVYFIASLNKETHFFGVTVRERKAFWVTFLSFVAFNIYFILLSFKLLAEWLSSDKTFISGLEYIFLHKSIITPFYFGRADLLSQLSGFTSFFLLHMIWTYFAYVTWRLIPKNATNRLIGSVVSVNIILIFLTIASIQTFYFIIFYPAIYEILSCPIPYSRMENLSVAKSIIASENYRWAAFNLWILIVFCFCIRKTAIVKKMKKLSGKLRQK